MPSVLRGGNDHAALRLGWMPHASSRSLPSIEKDFATMTTTPEVDAAIRQAHQATPEALSWPQSVIPREYAEEFASHLLRSLAYEPMREALKIARKAMT